MSCRESAAPVRVFDSYLMVDWSAASAPKRGRDSIWVARVDHGMEDRASCLRSLDNPPTRWEAMRLLREMLRGPLAGRRVLLGFDFAMGYPAGFAGRVVGAGVAGSPWRSTIDLIDELVIDDERNRHNRDAVASALNRRIGDGPGPFWGCARATPPDNVPPRRKGLFTFVELDLREYRLTEKRLRSQGHAPKSVWQIGQGVSVGGQTLLGLKHVAELRFRSGHDLEQRIRLWPYEIGWALPEESNAIVVAEIYPSLFDVRPEPAEVIDSAQVRTVAQHYARLDELGRLAACFGPPAGLTNEELDWARNEEGWILGPGIDP